MGVFAVVEFFATALWFILGRAQWFYLDEWDFLSARTAGNLHDLFRPHNEHWSTLPILMYRLLWWMFGLRTYAPYLAVVLLLHITAAALLRVVMRRAGVDPWIATAAASLFALYGAGYQDIVRAFQMTFTGSLVFGLVQLLLADHGGPIDRRDGLAVLSGLAGLLCSGVAVTMTIAVGVATFTRRGWRAAALQTLPLGALYTTWLLTSARGDYSDHGSTPALIVRFVAVGLRTAYRNLGQLPMLGVLLALLLPLGFVCVITDPNQREHLARAAAPLGLLAGSVVFLVVAGVGRAGIFGPQRAMNSRYIYLVAAMSLPALAVGADAIVRRWRLLMPLMLALFLIGIPGNIRDLANFEHGQRQSQASYRQLMLSLPHVAFATQVPRAVRPEPQLAYLTTIGWLLDGARSGRIPAPPHIPARLRASDIFRLSLEQSQASAPGTPCRNPSPPIRVALTRGESLRFRGGSLIVAPRRADLRATLRLSYSPHNGGTLTAVAPVDVILSDAAPFVPATVCGSALRNAKPA